MKNIYITLFILSFSSSIFAEERFTRVNDVVTDSVTKLEWMDANRLENDNVTPRDLRTRTWDEGLNYCENTSFNSKSDWRVPNINELKTIIDRSDKPLRADEEHTIAINDIFENIGRNNVMTYASSTTTATLYGKMFVVRFHNGEVLGDDISKISEESAYYRCVRGG